MKANTWRRLGGVAAPLILTGSVQAGFVGIKVVSKPNEFGLLVCNLYAEFDRPGEDFFLKVAGTANSPLLIEVIFSLDGLGLLGFEAAINRDYPVMFGTLFFFTVLGLFMQLVGDLTYTVIDPRIDFEAREV